MIPRLRWGILTLLCTFVLFAANNASVCIAWASSTVSKQEAEELISGVFHPGKVEKVTQVTSQSNVQEWNLLYANGDTALVTLSGVVERFSSIATAASAKGSTTKQEAIAIARRVIKKLGTAHYKLITLDPLHPNVLNGAQYTVSFTRVVNGIPFPANGFKVGVNRDGSIASYSATWTNRLAFPEKAGVLSKKDIIKHAESYFTSNPHATLFYYLLPWAKSPKLLYLVQTEGGQAALYANNGNLVRPPGSSSTTSTIHVLWYQRAWFQWTSGGFLGLLILCAVFMFGLRMGRNQSSYVTPSKSHVAPT